MHAAGQTQISRIELSPWNGAHTTLPVLGVDLPEFAKVMTWFNTGMHILELTGDARQVANFR